MLFNQKLLICSFNLSAKLSNITLGIITTAYTYTIQNYAVSACPLTLSYMIMIPYMQKCYSQNWYGRSALIFSANLPVNFFFLEKKTRTIDMQKAVSILWVTSLDIWIHI